MGRPRKKKTNGDATQETQKPKKPAIQKHLYLFRFQEGNDTENAIYEYVTDGMMTLDYGRHDLIGGQSDGSYLLLEDTSAVLVRRSTVETKVTVDFVAPRKRARKATE